MAKPNAEATFRAKSPGIMAQLMADFPIGVEDAAASAMTLAEITELLSRIGRRNPELVQSKDGRLLIEALIEEAKKPPASK